MKYVWMYWENAGRRKPEYINLCIESVAKHKGSLQLNVLNEESITQYLPDLRPEWRNFKKAAHKADYIRTRLAYKFGGMWIDCDMVALSDLERLWKFPDMYDYACQDIETSIGCFIARPGCKLLEKVMDAQDRVLDSDREIEWNEIGNELMAEYGKGYKYYQWPKWTVDEVSGGKVSKLLSTEEGVDENVDRNAIIFHLCNSCVGPLIKKGVRDRQLMTSNMLMSKIFRRAYEIAEPAEMVSREGVYDGVVRALRRAHWPGLFKKG